MEIKEILPQEHIFTKVLCDIALMPEMLYYRGVLPGSVVLDGEVVPPEASDTADSADTRGRLAKLIRPSQQHQMPLAGSRGLEGGCDVERPKCVAIVGARKHTSYGKEIAYKLAYELAKEGVVVISGLAIGIDTVAHRGALDGGGVTVAVLGTEIGHIYPRQHYAIGMEILQRGGCMMSEHPVGERFYRENFLQRNRIISGLSDAVVVVEANLRSGSLNTAGHALEQGRQIFAVPGDITRPISQGCNRLIQQGAYPYTGPEDVLKYLFPGWGRKRRKKTLIFGDNVDETCILRMIAAGVRDGEEIVARSEMDVVKFNQVITMLEIKGRVRGLGMNQWALE